MSKRTHTVDTKTLATLENKVKRVEYLTTKINNMLDELHAIKDESSWLNYLGAESTETLTEDQNIRLCEIADTINRFKYEINL